ncbi:putative triacylglycerol lipase [Phaeomoniella chlamydospora]|uniref:Carboxylic ester hydrolase n=1 Tax=Phaeomoniella chlamydospora TaxID=158046 RepID=A0A0G2HFG0_PHACM|nr:putative triacylglycerol lipase [Phaeomoniella chlamydospora]
MGTEFGGNPKHVVIGGNSAGAASVTLHLTAYGGRNDGLFHASASESQSFGTIFTVAESQYQYDSLVARTNCTGSSNTLECLRNLPAAALQSVNINVPSPGASSPPLYMYSPVLDHDLVQDYTYAAYGKGNFIHLPAIYGDDTNEGTNFVPENTSTINESDEFIRNQWASITPQQVNVINQLYPNPNLTFPNSGPYWRQASDAYGEIRYICPGIFCSASYGPSFSSSGSSSSSYGQRRSPIPPQARRHYSQSIRSNTAVWNYRYNVLDPTQAAEGYGVPHTVELNAIFGPEYVNGAAPASYEAENSWIVPLIQAYWISFIRFFDPNVVRLHGSPAWEPYEWGRGIAGAGSRLRFGTEDGGQGVEMEDIQWQQKKRCEYLWSIGISLRQ